MPREKLPMVVLVEGGVETLAVINRRGEPVLDELLPDGVSLMRAWGLATSERADYISCRALGVCIEDANDLLEFIATNADALPERGPSGSQFYSHIRKWGPPKVARRDTATSAPNE